MCVLFCENANYNFADFPLGFLLGRLCGGLFVIYVFLVFYVIRTYVLSCLRWFEIADRVRNEGLDGFQVRWCFKIVVEAAAGGVFAHHKARAVGKARRPFIRPSCRRAAYMPDVAALGMCRFLQLAVRSLKLGVISS